MVTDIKFSIIEDGKNMSATLNGTEDYDLEALADILTGMYMMENDSRRYNSGKNMVIKSCKKLMDNI